MERQQLDYADAAQQETGSQSGATDRVLLYPFDRYVVAIRLDDEGRFLAIESIALNRSFLSQVQEMIRLRNTSAHDVDAYYFEATEE